MTYHPSGQPDIQLWGETLDYHSRNAIVVGLEQVSASVLTGQ
jgi:hypothetical protein